VPVQARHGGHRHRPGRGGPVRRGLGPARRRPGEQPRRGQRDRQLNDLALPATPAGYTGTAAAVLKAAEKATGEMVAVNQDTGTVDGDYVIAGAGVALSSTQRDMIIAYKLGAIRKLPGTAGS
jgi:hypothetical protein